MINVLLQQLKMRIKKYTLGMYMKWISEDLFNTNYMMPLLFAKSLTETNNSSKVAAANMNFKFSATLGPN